VQEISSIIDFMRVWSFQVYPVRNNAPLLPPGQRPSLRGRSPSGAEPGPAAAAGLWVTFQNNSGGISNGVYQRPVLKGRFSEKTSPL